jgi:NADH-quinone oxidoreductase subunit E
MSIAKVDSIIDRYRAEPGSLTTILQDIQAEYNYLPKPALIKVSERVGLPLSQAYSLATFYKAFSLEPRGRHLISVCLGTACHVRGGVRIKEKLERDLKVRAGQTTKDKMFTLQTVNCLGCCALGPIVVIDGQYHGQVTQSSVSSILKECDRSYKGERNEKTERP